MTADDHAFAAYLCNRIANEDNPRAREILASVLDEFERLFP